MIVFISMFLILLILLNRLNGDDTPLIKHTWPTFLSTVKPDTPGIMMSSSTMSIDARLRVVYPQ